MRFFISACLLLLSSLVVNGKSQDLVARSKAFMRQTSKDKIRCFWIYYKDKSPDFLPLLPTLKQNGFNMLAVGNRIFWGATPSDSPSNKPYFKTLAPEQTVYLRKVVRACKKNGIVPLIMMMTYSDEYNLLIKDKKYRKVMDKNGIADRYLACPGDLDFLRGIELPRIQLAARILAEENMVGGFLYETEAYCAKPHYPGYGSSKTEFCYCDHCFGNFMKLIGDNGALPKPSLRYQYLSKRGLTKRYSDYMISIYEKNYKFLLKEARKIHPGMLAGLYQSAMDENTIGFARATGTKELPAMLFSSTEYFVGINRKVCNFANASSTDDFKKYLKSQNVNVRLLPGLLLGSYWPKQYAAETAQALKHTDGYWLYDGTTLNKPFNKVKTKNPENRSEYRLLRPAEEFFKYLAKAHKTKSSLLNNPPRKTLSEFTCKMKLDKKASQFTEPKTINPGWEPSGDFPQKTSDGIIFPAASKDHSAYFNRYIAGGFSEFPKGGKWYGFKVDVKHLGGPEARIVSLGHSWGKLYPVCFDGNFYIAPGEHKTLSIAIKSRPSAKYYYRFGCRTGEGTLAAKNFRLMRLSRLVYRSAPVSLPQNDKELYLTWQDVPSVFELSYDIFDLQDNLLMENCNRKTDISVLAQTLDVKKVKFKFNFLLSNGKKEIPPFKFSWLKIN